MDKILAWIKAHLIIALIIIIIIVPVLVYFLSVLPLFPSGDNNDWAGFWGGYIGAIIGCLLYTSSRQCQRTASADFNCWRRGKESTKHQAENTNMEA